MESNEVDFCFYGVAISRGNGWENESGRFFKNLKEAKKYFKEQSKTLKPREESQDVSWLFKLDFTTIDGKVGE